MQLTLPAYVSMPCHGSQLTKLSVGLEFFSRRWNSDKLYATDGLRANSQAKGFSYTNLPLSLSLSPGVRRRRRRAVRTQLAVLDRRSHALPPSTPLRRNEKNRSTQIRRVTRRQNVLISLRVCQLVARFIRRVDASDGAAGAAVWVHGVIPPDSDVLVEGGRPG